MRSHRPLAALLATVALVGACSKDDTPHGSKEVAAVAATADTGNALGATPAAGAVAVTPADAKAVTTATEFKLTEDNFAKFVAASSSFGS